MPTWEYDSYCNDNVFDYLEQFKIKELFARVENDMNDYYENEHSEIDKEFLIGVSIYCIRKGKEFSNKFLNKIINVIDFLTENSKFNGWKDPIKRKNRLLHEKMIIQNIINGKKFKFNLIFQPDIFEDLNPNY